MASDDNIYWGVIRNKDKRATYIEISEGDAGRWNVVLDTDEFTIRVPRRSTPDFFDLLESALAKRRAT